MMNNWMKFTGAYEKQFYDLTLKSGTIIYHCWPYKGNFNPVNGTGASYIEGARIEKVRISEIQWNF